MDTTIKAHVGITYDDYKKYALFGMWQKRRKTLPITVIFIGLIGYYVNDTLNYLAKYPMNYLLVAITALLILAVLFSILQPFLRMKRDYRKSKLLNDQTGIYEFTKVSVCLQGADPDLNGNEEYTYSTFTKGYETKYAFYLRMPGRQALIIPKTNIYEGTPEGLSELLKAKMKEFVKS